MEAARILSGEDEPARDESEAEQQHLRVMIESMLREGRSEAEIVAAVEQAGGT
jgi:hypothetical protein